LARNVEMNQNAISRLENPNYGKATLTTLRRVARAFDVALIVRFVPFSQLADWVSGTPYIDKGLSPETLRIPSFTQEISVRPELGSVEDERAEQRVPRFQPHSVLGSIAGGAAEHAG
jgi:hypothetical protein